MDQKKQILKLLKTIKKYVENQRDVDSPTRLCYLETYLKKYSEGETKITMATFVECHDPKRETADPKNTVRKYFGEHFRPFLEEYFRNEGKESQSRLEIPTGGYYLSLVPNESATVSRQEITTVEPPKSNERTTSDSTPKDIEQTPLLESIAYEETRYLRLKYNRLLYTVLAFVLIAILCFSATAYFILPLLRKLTITVISIEIALAFIVALVGFTGYALLRLPERKFVHFGGYYFLGVRDSNAILASYSSKCPLCGGDIQLISRKVKWRGYIGECHNYPEGHVFSFDFMSLRGERL